MNFETSLHTNITKHQKCFLEILKQAGQIVFTELFLSLIFTILVSYSLKMLSSYQNLFVHSFQSFVHSHLL